MKTPETEEQLRAMIEDVRVSLEPLIMEQPDEAKSSYQQVLRRMHGTPREFARAAVMTIGEISVDEAKAAIAKYRKRWDAVVKPQPISRKSLIFRDAMRNIEAQLSDGFASALEDGMHRDVMIEVCFVFGKVAHNCSLREKELRAAIKPCGVEGCRCHVLQNKLLDTMIKFVKDIKEADKH